MVSSWEGEVKLWISSAWIEESLENRNKVWKILEISVEFSLNKHNTREIQFSQSEGSFQLINLIQYFNKDTF